MLYANAALASLGRVPIEWLIGRHTSEFYADPPDREAFIRDLAKDGRILGREVCLSRLDGTTYWAMLSSVRAELDGNPVNVTSIWDVSHRSAKPKIGCAWRRCTTT